MKSINYIIISLLILLGSCKKYLEPKPTDFLNPGNYYETEEQLLFARSSVYNNLGAGGLWGSSGNYLLGFQGDEGYMNRPTLTTGPWNYFYSIADVYLTGFWSNLWNGINRANVLIANVDKNPAISDSLRSVIRGEAMFLRGYYYFTLAQYFGGVPLKLTPTTTVTDVALERAGLAETYAQIIQDMEAAEALVPVITNIGNGGTISKSAVRGLLARVNLVMAGAPLNDNSRYSEVVKWAKMVMDDPAHSLNASYPQIFMNYAQDRYDIKESIWEVEFWGNRTDQYVETTNNGYINGPSSPANSATGRADSYMSITSKFYDVFEPGDNRKWYSIAHFTYSTSASAPLGTKTLNDLPATEAAKNLMRPAKWRREFETLLPKAPTTTPQNVPLLRFSDILLMYAEAENAINGPTPAAIEAVNRVRRRGWSKGIKNFTITSGGAGYTTAPSVLITGGGGTGIPATATAVVEGGVVTAINLNRDSTGIGFFKDGTYISTPTISISGGGGSGATATATIYTAADADLSAAQTASKENFLAAIQDERSREFNYENIRKADLLRWGIIAEVYSDLGVLLQEQSPNMFFVKYFTNFVTPRDLLMPIPNSEMTTNIKMTQNPGWN